MLNTSIYKDPRIVMPKVMFKKMYIFHFLDNVNFWYGNIGNDNIVLFLLAQY